MKFKKAGELIADAKTILIIQGENPDGDSLGSALALEAILGDMGKKTELLCAVEIPKYLRYVRGWDRVQPTLPREFDLTIIVDTASKALLERALSKENLPLVAKKPVLVLDHHLTEGDLPLEVTTINDPTKVATAELIYHVATELKWPLPLDACEAMAIAILSDTLGLMTESVTAESIRVVADLVEHGVRLSDIENRRREFMKKSAEILEYKGKLLQRIEYYADGALAFLHIPWDEIAAYSDQYNPSVLALDEMRLVEGVRLAVAIKTYPDGKVTGKLRANPDAPVAETVAGFFGGGGHAFAAGFKVYDEDANTVKTELIGAVDKALREHDKTVTTTEPC